MHSHRFLLIPYIHITLIRIFSFCLLAFFVCLFGPYFIFRYSNIIYTLKHSNQTMCYSFKWKRIEETWVCSVYIGGLVSYFSLGQNMQQKCLREERFALAWAPAIQSVALGEGGREHHEICDHIASAVRKQRWNLVLSSLSPCFAAQYPSPWNNSLALGMGLPPAIKTLWQSSHRLAQRCVSQVILSPIKLTVYVMYGSLSPWRPRGAEL